MYVYICMCICVYVNVSVYRYTCVYAYASTYIHIHIYREIILARVENCGMPAGEHVNFIYHSVASIKYININGRRTLLYRDGNYIFIYNIYIDTFARVENCVIPSGETYTFCRPLASIIYINIHGRSSLYKQYVYKFIDI